MIRILSLNDELEMGDLMSLIPERKGYEYFFTSDSYEAWVLLHSMPVCLVNE